MNDRLPCGCRRDGRYVCFEHRMRWWDMIASDPLALISLSLFISMIAVVAAIFEG